jgi:hypothetical protein
MIDIEKFKNLIHFKEVDNNRFSTYTFNYVEEVETSASLNNAWYPKIGIAPIMHEFSIDRNYNFNNYNDNSFEKLIVEKYYNLSIQNKNRDYYKIVDMDIRTDKIIRNNKLDDTFYRKILSKIMMTSNILTIDSGNSCNRLIIHPKLLNILMSNDKYSNSFTYNVDTRMYSFSMLHIWVSQFIPKDTILFLTNFVDMSNSVMLFYKDNYFTLVETENSIKNYINIWVYLKHTYQLRKEKLNNILIY